MSIFLDENTKVVYQGLTGSIGRYYGNLNREYGTTLVLVSHDLDLAERCDRIIRMEAGHIQAPQPAAEEVSS